MKKQFFSAYSRRHDGAPLVIEPVEPRKDMESSKAGQLANTLIDGVKAFEAKVEEANAFFTAQLKEGNDTVDAVVDQGRKLGDGVARLKAALGNLTNGGPPLGE